MINVDQKLFGFRIIVYDIRGISYGRIKVLIWRGYRFEQFSRWMWYFKYRYGLEIVNNPKHIVEYNQFNEEPDLRSVQRIKIDSLKKDITTKKRDITKISNAIKAYEEEQSNKLFFDKSIRYINTVKKLESKKIELEELEKELKQIQI